MRLEYYSSEKLKGDIKNIAGKYLDLGKYKVFFFGSRVAGGGNERSDIDIGIEGKEKISWDVMARIKEDIDNLPILYKIDFIDFKRVPPDFYNVATKNIEVL